MTDSPARAEGPTPETTWLLICTYQRNDLLARLLDSLRSVRMPAGSTINQPQLIVVDNSPEPTAEDLVQSYPDARYVHQPRPGIATARNTSLETVPADATAVVFLDDDEQVTPEWFAALLTAGRESSADAVTGPVVPIFEGGEPSWVSSYGYVRRTNFPSGPHPRRVATNNTLVLARWFQPPGRGGRGFRFDETFNFIGGSDSDLFERMMYAGAKYWWCAEAVVTEHVPVERATQQWLRRRAQRGGHVRVAKKRARTSPSSSDTVALAAEGLARASYGAVRRFSRRARGRTVTYTDDYYLCEGIGMLQSLMGQGRVEYARKS